MREDLTLFNPEFPKMDNTVKIQLLEDDKVVQEVTTKNLVTDLVKGVSQYMYATMSGMPSTKVGNASFSIPNFMSGMTLSLWDNTSSLANNLYFTGNNGNMNLVGYCTDLATYFSNSKQGVCLPTAFTYGKGSITYCWEWATTQGNGTIKSLGFTSGPSGGLSADTNLSVVYAGNVPGLGYCQTYIGYNVVGSDTIFYFRNFSSGAGRTAGVNNILGIKETDMTSYETLSLNIAGAGGLSDDASGLAGGGDTVLCGDKFYTITAISGSALTFKIAPKSTLTYGSATPISYTTVGGGTHYIECLTADDRYIYAAVRSVSTSKAMVVKIDTTTNTTVSVLDVTPIMSNTGTKGNFTEWWKLVRDPFDSDVLWFLFANIAHKFSLSNGINSPFYWQEQIYHGMGNGNCIDLFYKKDGMYLFRPKNTSTTYSLTPSSTSYFTNISVQDFSTCIFRTFGLVGYLLTYAELPTPVTKTSTQSMRVQYTFQVF